MPPGSSEWMIGRPPACWFRAAFCWIPSIASSLNPHQSAHTETDVPSLASRSATRVWGFPRGALLRAGAARGDLLSLPRARGEDLEIRAAPADQVRRPRQRLDRGDAAGDRERNLRVLRPKGVLRPHLDRHRV